jgi:serine/threonine protein phosphatase PrpC
MTKSFAGTDTGLHRKGNEDSFLHQPERGLFAVADGLGGLSFGEVASKIAVDHLGAVDMAAFDDLAALVREISGKIRDKGNELGKGTIGTTLTLAIVEGMYFRIAQVGDSMAYLALPDGKNVQLTREHTLAEEYRKAGKTNIDPYLEHVLTQCLGQEAEVNPDVFVTEFPVGARLLLCSDGITKTVEDAEIYSVLRTGVDPKSIVEALIKKANERGGPDNSTVVVVFQEPDAAK